MTATPAAMTAADARYRAAERLIREERLSATATARRLEIHSTTLRTGLARRGWRFRRIGAGLSLCLHDPDGTMTGRSLRDDRTRQTKGSALPIDPKIAAEVEAARAEGRRVAREAVARRIQRLVLDNVPIETARAIVLEGWP